MSDSPAKGKWFKGLLTLLLMGVAIWFIASIGNLIKLVIIATILAYILDPVVGFLESSGLSRKFAASLMLVMIFGVTSIFIVLLLPHVKSELKTISSGISAGKAADIAQRLESNMEDKLSALGVKDLNLMEKFQEFSKGAASKAYGYALDAMGLVSNLLLITFMLFFFLKDGREFIKLFVTLIPNEYFEMTLSLMHKTDKQLGSYIRGQFLDSAIIGGLTIIALWALDIKYFFLLGVVLGISNLVPVIGPIIGSLPAIAMALIQTGNVRTVLYVAAAMVFVQMVDNFMVKPVVVARSVSLHPVVVILAVIIGGKFFGIIGMILSIPLVGIIKLIAEEASTNIRKFRFTY